MSGKIIYVPIPTVTTYDVMLVWLASLKSWGCSELKMNILSLLKDLLQRQ